MNASTQISREEKHQEVSKVKKMKPLLIIFLLIVFLFYSFLTLSTTSHAAEVFTVSGNETEEPQKTMREYLSSLVFSDATPFFSSLDYSSRITLDDFYSLKPLVDEFNVSYINKEINSLDRIKFCDKDTPVNDVFFYSLQDYTVSHYDSDVLRSKEYQHSVLYYPLFSLSKGDGRFYCFIKKSVMDETCTDDSEYGLYSFDSSDVTGYPFTSVGRKYTSKWSSLKIDTGTGNINNSSFFNDSSHRYSSDHVVVNIYDGFEDGIGSDRETFSNTLSFKSNIAVFNTKEDALAFFQSGDTSNILNGENFGEGNTPDSPDKPDSNFHLYRVKCNKVLSKIGLTAISWQGVTDDGFSCSVPNERTLVIPTFIAYGKDNKIRVFAARDLDCLKDLDSLTLRFNGGNILKKEASSFTFMWDDVYTELDKMGYLWDGDVWLSPSYLLGGEFVHGLPTIVDCYKGTISEVEVDEDTGEEIIKPVTPNGGSDISGNDSGGGSGGSGSDIVPGTDSNGVLDFFTNFIKNLPEFIEYFINIFNSLLSWLGSLPQFFNSVFSFLPYEIRLLLYGSIFSICIVSFLKAVIF